MKKLKTQENYLDKIPKKNSLYHWKTDDNGVVTLEVKNCGIMNKIAQKLLKKPKVSYIHLDEFGSFVWKQINGEKNLVDIGICIEEQFGEKAHPLYERLAQFIMMLESYGFIQFEK